MKEHNKFRLVCTALLLAGCAATLACCQQRSQQPKLYKLTKVDLARMQERSEVLRTAGQSGWELGYIAIANAEWAAGEQSTALSRFITTMAETQSFEHRGSAFRACLRLLDQASRNHNDDKEYAQQLENFSFHCKKILLSVPVTQANMSGENGPLHASVLSDAAHFWETRDQGAAEQAAETMLTLADFLATDASMDTKTSAKLLLSRIFEKGGKYEAAYLAYQDAIATTDFAGLGESANFVREMMLTEKVRLLALFEPGLQSTRIGLASRALELRTAPLTWVERVDTFSSLLKPLEIEGLKNERIDGLMYFVQSAPAVANSTPAEEVAVTDLLSRLQGADHASVGRPDAALLAYDILIARSAVQADRDRHTTARNQLVQRLNP